MLYFYQAHSIVDGSLIVCDCPVLGDKQSGGSGLGGTSNGKSSLDGGCSRDRRSGTGSGSDSFGEADRHKAGYTPPYEDEPNDRYNHSIGFTTYRSYRR